MRGSTQHSRYYRSKDNESIPFFIRPVCQPLPLFTSLPAGPRILQADCSPSLPPDTRPHPFRVYRWCCCPCPHRHHRERNEPRRHWFPSHVAFQESQTNNPPDQRRRCLRGLMNQPTVILFMERCVEELILSPVLRSSSTGRNSSSREAHTSSKTRQTSLIFV